MVKKIFYVFLMLVFWTTLNMPVLAKQSEQILPEEEGIYNIPGRPDLKLRVFVYHGKPDKPVKPTPTEPSLICPVADPDSNATVEGAGWVLPSSWTYRLNSNSVPTTVGSDNLANITISAFDEWLEAINNKVKVVRGADTTMAKAQLDGQNIITWGRASGNALAVTYIWYNNQGVATEIDTIMNKSFTWYWSNNQSCAYEGVYDAQNILTHELGHTFGLDDHYTSEYINNTMYGYGAKTETKKNTLTVGDRTGVASLYY
ncbi:MAG TPA: matrixin family metalloprotease [bacterium]|nr:matrixin family metalloprotease [bacterium]HPL95831.1 matrixin family metalloprotease [bacterium]